MHEMKPGGWMDMLPPPHHPLPRQPTMEVLRSTQQDQQAVNNHIANVTSQLLAAIPTRLWLQQVAQQEPFFAAYGISRMSTGMYFRSAYLPPSSRESERTTLP